MDQKWIFRGIESLHERFELCTRHPEAGRHRDIDMSRPGLARRPEFVTIPGFRRIRPAQVQDRLDLAIMKGERQALIRASDPIGRFVGLHLPEVVIGLIPGDEHHDRMMTAATQTREPIERFAASETGSSSWTSEISGWPGSFKDRSTLANSSMSAWSF